MSVDIDVMGRTQYTQTKTVVFKKGDTAGPIVPFFYERNATKDYNDLFSFRVRPNVGKPLSSRLNPCENTVDVRAQTRVVRVGPDGWTISTGSTVKCRGKWDVPKVQDVESQVKEVL